MEISSIGTLAELKHIIAANDRVFTLLYKSNTEKSNCALDALNELDDNTGEIIVFLKADVTTVKDIHPEYGIETVPSLLEFRSGKLVNVFKGCNNIDFYRSAIRGARVRNEINDEKRQKNVIVYSTPTCTWCNTLKSYLKERKVNFRDIDVSMDQKAAEQMVNKSGQQGVPQTDIDGQVIVGFDKNRIDNLLELGK